MGKALYRTYRSRNFDDVVGQEHVTTTLKNALSSGRVSHAYLFTGPRGVGKTSVARILAHEINSINYSDDEVHLDIIEIDAASNRRIDEIRDLRDKVHIAPASARYKVYIIDEVHMLTKEAFNALLKTLEEPPEHCIFILATTELSKVPPTIVSRTQRFNFKPIDNDVAAKRLGLIAKNENIAITKEALDLIAANGQGSFRDSLSMLDQLGSGKKEIDAEAVRELLGLPEASLVKSIYAAITEGDSLQLASIMGEIRLRAMNPNLVASNIADVVRADIAQNSATAWKLELLRGLIDVGPSINQYAALELALLEAALKSAPDKKSTIAVDDKPTQITADNESLSAPSVEDKEESSPLTNTINSKSNLDDQSFKTRTWPDILEAIKKEAASIYTALRLAEPQLDAKAAILYLNFQFPLHQKKVDTAKAKSTIAGVIEQLTGLKLVIQCQIDKTLKNAKSEPSKEQNTVTDASVESISNIFGGVEVLESEALL